MSNLFKPNLTPKDCIQSGIFGGVYFDATQPKLIQASEFPQDWFEGLKPESFSSHKADPERNKYKKMAGTYQREWESKGWIDPSDPRGWFQWYCRYSLGRRGEDDARQMERWVRFASVERGRWTARMYSLIHQAGGIDHLHDFSISPVIRQSLLHWAYEVNEKDYLLKLDFS